MKRRRLLWQIYPSYLLITLLSLVAIGWVASRSLGRFYLDSVEHDLERQARVVDTLLGPEFAAEPSSSLQNLCAKVGQTAEMRITIVALSGEVICETGTRDSLENHANRPEFKAALVGGIGA